MFSRPAFNVLDDRVPSQRRAHTVAHAGQRRMIWSNKNEPVTTVSRLLAVVANEVDHLFGGDAHLLLAVKFFRRKNH